MDAAGPRAVVHVARLLEVDRLVVVPLVGPVPPRPVDVLRGVVVSVLDDHVRLGRPGRVAEEVRADEAAVPLPLVLGVGRGMDAGEAATALDVVLERGLLRRVEHVARGRQEDHGVVVRERGVEDRGVLGVIDLEVVRLTERLDRRDGPRRSSRAESRPSSRRRAPGSEPPDRPARTRSTLTVRDRSASPSDTVTSASYSPAVAYVYWGPPR